MKIIGRDVLEDFKRKRTDAQSHIESWEAEVEKAFWQTPHDLKAQFPKATLLGKQQAIFDIRGNRYRLWVKIAYKSGVVMIKKAGTHKEYEKWEIE